MGDVLDNLFSIIPIVLAILWVMRRASRKKTGDTAAKTQSEPKSGAVRISERLHRFEKKASKAVGNVRDDIIGNSTPERPPGEEELYKKIETRRVETTRSTVQKENTVERMVESRAEAEEGMRYSGPEKSNSFERFRDLPPLAQGMVWSIILDEPPALKEPKN